MMVILEGPDGSGKSTLAKYLCKHYGLQYVHTDKPAPGEDVFRSYQRTLHTNEDVVFDRLFHGEAVYGPLMRGKSLLSPTQLAYLELEAADALVIWCEAPAERLVARGDPIYQKLDAQRLLNKYALVREQSSLTCWRYDSSLALPNELPGLPALLPRFPGRCVGGAKPRVVLVGEQFPGQLPHHSSERWEKDLLHWRPFDNSRSGEYLLKALLHLPYKPSDLRLTNAIKQHLSLSKSRLMLQHECEGTKVIAMGNEAEKELARAGVTVSMKIPHPQWWSRFHHDRLADYVELLRAAIT